MEMEMQIKSQNEHILQKENNNNKEIEKNNINNDNNDINSDSNEDKKPPTITVPCEICKLRQYKYKCPRCLLKTCSLLCVKKHKKQFNCSGVKDKFSKTFTNQNEFNKDIKYLNETLRDSNASCKKAYLLNEEDDEKKAREKRNKYIRKCAKKFRGINLHSSPTIMKKFSENKSYVDYKNKRFFWTVKLNISVNFGDKKNPLTDSLTDPLINSIESSNSTCNKYQHLFPQPFDDIEYSIKDILDYFIKNKQEMNFELLRFINSIPEETILNSTLLYRIDIKENQVKGKVIKLNKMIYEECGKDLMLKDILEGKDVYEYPEFLIVLNL